jgi:hypothetical protein
MTATTTSHCSRCEGPIERGDLRCAICGMASPAAPGERQAGVTAQVFRCRGCGAAMAYDAKARAPACPCCASVLELENLEDPPEQVETFLPFTVKPQEAREALRRWLASLGWFRPGDLVSASRVDALKPLLFVAWVVDGDVLLSWTADSNVGGRKASWAPHSGETELAFDQLVVSASRGLAQDEVEALAPSYRVATGRDAPAPLDGLVSEAFDVQRSQARARIVEGIEATAARKVEQGLCPGSSHRNVHVSALLRKLVTRRAALPAYVLAYRYKDRLYRAVVSGQDASFVTGKAPWSVAKLALVVLAGLAVIATIVALLVR